MSWQLSVESEINLPWDEWILGVIHDFFVLAESQSQQTFGRKRRITRASLLEGLSVVSFSDLFIVFKIQNTLFGSLVLAFGSHFVRSCDPIRKRREKLTCILFCFRVQEAENGRIDSHCQGGFHFGRFPVNSLILLLSRLCHQFHRQVWLFCACSEAISLNFFPIVLAACSCFYFSSFFFSVGVKYERGQRAFIGHDVTEGFWRKRTTCFSRDELKNEEWRGSVPYC